MIKKSLSLFVLLMIVFLNAVAQPLDSFIRTAVKNSPLLYDLNNQNLAGKFDSLLLLATYQPQVSQLTQVIYPPVCA